MPTQPTSMRIKIRILELLASGRELEVVAPSVGMTREEVIDVVAAHGWPDRSKLRWALDRLREKTVDEVPPPRPLAVAPVPAAPSARVGFVETAKASEVASTRKLAEKVEQLLAELKTRVRTEERTRAEHAAQREEREEAQREVERLKAELKAAQARAGKPAGSVAARGLSAQVRAWAQQEGIECSARGRINADIMAKYEAAH